MKADKSNILDILAAQAKYIIPIYQRPYSWEYNQIYELWFDIVKTYKLNKEDYFIGAMVAVAETPSPNEINKFVIIDGQQRITTLILLLIALRDCYNENNQSDRAEEIQRTYLTTVYLGNTYNRIESKKKDQEDLISLITNTANMNKKSLVIDAYKFFKEQIPLSNIPYDELRKTINKLWAVQIVLDKDHGDAQAIFESLNSTGKSLTASDLIRNFLLMNIDYKYQDNIYNQYWMKLEKLFTIDNVFNNTIADNFIRDYLIMQNNNMPSKNRLYDEFKAYFYNLNISDKNIEVCKDLYNKAVVYHQIINANYKNDKEIENLLINIKNLQNNVIYPFVMKLIILYEEGQINHEDVSLALQLSISYILRRQVCALQSSSLNKIFAQLFGRIDLKDFSKSINEFFFSLKNKDRFPNDEEFMQCFATFNAYRSKQIKYIMKSLEEFNNKNLINIDSATIEHIMPQGTLNDEWQQMLGPDFDIVQEMNVHKIGNLTLTNYNSEMSNNDFLTKLMQDGGIKLTPYKLNQYFIKNDLKEWNEAEINKRSIFLANEATKIWIYPQVDKDFIGRRKGYYSNIDHFITSSWTREIYETIHDYVMSLDPGVTFNITKKYIAYRLHNKTFLSIVLKKSLITIGLHMKINEINDPEHICRDVTNIGHNHSGKSELHYTKKTNPTYAFDLITQSFNKNK
ncbi:GmrSD restriction endonuclease domain-containing protein [Mycoplasma sp. BRA290]|uniref:GmrSD restriction endonuclease domain-containing protein n=1 Tax=Mycoplasma sp. BRA290 TaxID=3401675 RepID=UPI003AADB8F2